MDGVYRRILTGRVSLPPSPHTRFLGAYILVGFIEKRTTSWQGMSWGIVGRTVEGAIVCKVLAILPGGIGNMQISNSTLPVSRVK